ncbi:unnamed protein product [Ilex paraguariensis]|uniref:Uncharacterized protein n=1 Tax=Ilex paraguariensis TaxID=185542 RepID=A0ABC8RJ47_9AQUA
MVGKISRCVSLVHYPKPSELQKENSKNLKQMYRRSSGTFATPTQSIRLRISQSVSGNAATMHSSRSSISGAGDPSNPPKRRLAVADEPTRQLTSLLMIPDKFFLPVASSRSFQ